MWHWKLQCIAHWLSWVVAVVYCIPRGCVWVGVCVHVCVGVCVCVCPFNYDQNGSGVWTVFTVYSPFEIPADAFFSQTLRNRFLAIYCTILLPSRHANDATFSTLGPYLFICAWDERGNKRLKTSELFKALWFSLFFRIFVIQLRKIW